MYDEPTMDLLKRLENPEYAKLYGEENAKTTFAITLTKARLSLNLTQKELASKLNLSQPYIAKLEGGEANPTLGNIGKLLATINLRLVTGTASLMPEPVIRQITINESSSGILAVADDTAERAWKSYSNAAGDMPTNPSASAIYSEGATA